MPWPLVGHAGWTTPGCPTILWWDGIGELSRPVGAAPCGCPLVCCPPSTRGVAAGRGGCRVSGLGFRVWSFVFLCHSVSCILSSVFSFQIDLTPFLFQPNIQHNGRVSDNPLLDRIYRINRIENCGIRGGQPPGSAARQLGKTLNGTSNIECSISNVQVPPLPGPPPRRGEGRGASPSEVSGKSDRWMNAERMTESNIDRVVIEESLNKVRSLIPPP